MTTPLSQSVYEAAYRMSIAAGIKPPAPEQFDLPADTPPPYVHLIPTATGTPTPPPAKPPELVRWETAYRMAAAVGIRTPDPQDYGLHPSTPPPTVAQ